MAKTQILWAARDDARAHALTRSSCELPRPQILNFGRRLLPLETAVETHPTDGVAGTAGERSDSCADHGVSGGGFGLDLVGVVPVNLVAGVAGAVLIVLNLGVLAYGFSLFLVSSLLWNWVGWRHREASLVLLQSAFTVINFLCFYRWAQF